ncbi:MAG: RNA methyltransferase [Planctomycetota bacterium]|nr:RNA methyltransferase [Planctomycetota bacterium]
MKRVILCRPEGPRNVGTILRVAQNFGPTELWLVEPQKASMLVHPDFEQMSHGADEARDQIRIVATLAEALEDVHLAVAFTARVRGKRTRRDWREVLPQIVPIANDLEQRLALVLGNEIAGLTVDEVNLCQEVVHMRTSNEHTSLNLAMCAGIALSDLFLEDTVHQKEPGGSLLDGKGREFLKARLRAFATQVLRTPAAEEDVLAMIERVFSRAPLENRDARGFHLLLKTLGSTMEPAELGLQLHRKDGRRLDALARRQAADDGGTE